MQFLSKYGVARHIYVPIVKRAVVDFAVGADWSPAAGDVKISKDGGAAANVTNLPTAIAMGNTAEWDFSLTATEMQAAQIVVTVADAATKAVEDQCFIIETYGNASGQHPFDLATATQKVDVDTIKTQAVTCAGGVTVPAATLASTTNITAGVVTTATNVTTVNGLANNVITAASINADAITAAKVADGTIDAATFAAGAINAAAISDAAIDRATFAADTGLQSVRSNTAQAGAAGTVTLDASASAVDSFYTDAYVYLTGGTGVGQCRLITGYTGATKVATVTPNWATNPDNTSTFAVLPFGRVDVGFWLGAIVSALQSGRVDSYLGAVAAAVITSGAFAAGAIDAAALATDAIGAAELAQGAAQEIADEILNRNLAGGGSGGARIVRDALRVLRNKVAESAGTMTVYQEDDASTAWTATTSRTAGLDPLTTVDPA